MSPFHTTRIVIALAVAIVIVNVSSIASASDEDCFDVLGRYDFHSLDDVAIAHPYAYLLSGPLLRILRISDPENPQLVSSLMISPFSCYDSIIAVSGDYVYTVTGRYSEGYLSVVNVRDPNRPVVTSSIPVSNPNNLAVEGMIVYLVDGDGNGKIIDASMPSQPRIIAEFSLDEDPWVRSLRVSEGYAYLGGSALWILDVSAPGSPTVVSTTEVTSVLDVITLDDNYLYAHTQGNDLSLFNVTNPSEPIAIVSFDLPDWPKMALATFENIVCLVTYKSKPPGYQSTLRVFDVSVPSQPIEIASKVIPYAQPTGLFLTAEHLYLNLSDEFRVFDMTTPEQPIDQSSFGNPSFGWDVAVSGDHAFVAAGKAGLRVLDLSSMSSIEEVAFLDTPGSARAVEISGEFAFVADYSAGVRVIDISSPLFPVEVGYLNIDLEAKDITIFENWAVVTTPQVGAVIDISAPSTPVLLSFIDRPSDITVVNRRAYVVCGQYLKIYDLSDPQDPIMMGSLEILDVIGGAIVYSGFNGVTVHQGIAYISNGVGLRAIDVSNPTEPSVVFEGPLCDPTGGFDCPVAGRMAKSGKYLFQILGDWYDTWTVVWDISDPSSPEYTSYHPGGAWGNIRVGGRNIYLIDYSLRILPRCLDINIRLDEIESDANGVTR